MRSIFDNHKKGITLVEIIIYLALFGMIFITIIEFFFSIVSYNQSTQDRNRLQYETIFVAAHIEESAMDADSVNTTNTIFDSATGTLYLDTASGYIEYSIVDDRVQVNRDGVTNFITSGRVAVNNFFLEDILDPFGNVIGFRLNLDIANPDDTNMNQQIQSSFLVE